uniref:FAD-binding domain-containing protein n=1 Tax=Psilocybe cubensis TaxID=181762 RepID=A0A8H8CPH5_PSICU
MPPSPAIPAPWVQDVDQEELLKAYEPEFGGDILAIIRLMTRPKRWALHMIYPPLKTYVKDRIALIGDAAHAMVPFIGAGAGQGFEDVYAICRILSHPKVTKSRLSDAFVMYDNYRRPLANKTLEQSLVAGDNLECFIPGGEDVTRQRIRMMYEDQWIQNLWHHDFDEEVTKILEEF